MLSNYRIRMHMDALFLSKILVACPQASGKQTNLRHRKVVSLLTEVADARDESLMTLFSLSNSAVLAQFSAECLRGMENAQPDVKAYHSGPVTQKSLHLLAAVMIVPFPQLFSQDRF